MKKFIINLFALTITIYVTGCYTVVWDPVAEKFPSEQNSYDVYDGYYPENNFGDYSIYYDRPWWFDITPPAIVNNNYNRDADQNISIIRNLDRGSRTGVNWPILIINPPTRGSQQQTVNVNKPSNNTNTNPVSTGTTQTTRENSNSVRNNDGSRNTESRRKK